MKRICIFLSIFLIIINFTRGQKFVSTELFKSYNFERASNIIKDSIWLKRELWKNAGFKNLQKANHVKFLIIPVFDFANDASKYNGDTSLINYLKIENNELSAFVISNDSLIGYIKVGLGAIHENEIKQDSVTQKNYKDYLYPKGRIIGYRWVLSEEINFGEKITHFNFVKAIYNTIKIYKPKFYFMFPVYAWELWFIEGDRLKAYSIFKNKVVDEKELIESIKKYDKEELHYYYFKYK